MNLPFSLRQKVNIAAVLFCVMVCTIFINVLAEKSVTNMNSSIASIYNDRLVPATDLFEISSHVHEKMQLMDDLEKQRLTSALLDGTRDRINGHDIIITALVKKYERTYLVGKEKVRLKKLKLSLSNVLTLQQNLWKEQNPSSFKRLKMELFQTSKSVAELSHIQSIIGKELIAEAQSANQNSKIYSGAQFAVSVLIGILIFSILLTPSLLKVKQNQFALN